MDPSRIVERKSQGAANVNDVTLRWVHVVVSVATGTTNNRKTVQVKRVTTTNDASGHAEFNGEVVG